MSENKNFSNNRKKDLLSQEVEHIDITKFDSRELIFTKDSNTNIQLDDEKTSDSIDNPSTKFVKRIKQLKELNSCSNEWLMILKVYLIKILL